MIKEDLLLLLLAARKQGMSSVDLWHRTLSVMITSKHRYSNVREHANEAFHKVAEHSFRARSC